MITITTGDGKFFFSDFVNLFEEQSAEIDENALDLKELQYLLSAYNTKRIYTNEEDYVKIRDRIALLSTSSSGGGGDIDPALLGLKEDKSNKVILEYENSKALETRRQTFDYVICAIPFSSLRNIKIYPMLKSFKAELIAALEEE